MLVSALQALESAIRGAANRQLVRRLRESHVALQHGSVQAAIKSIDRAWRTMPDAARMLAPLYGRLLLLENRDPDAALRVLTRFDAPDADVAALTARALFRLRRSDDARRSLDAALRTYSVAPQGLLSREASAAIEIAELQASGWIGLSPTLEFVGELAPGHSADSLRIRLGEVPIKACVHATDRDGRVHFSFPAPPPGAGETLRVSSLGCPLLGSGHRLPLEFALDGRIDADARHLVGWARIGWLPGLPVELRFEDELGGVIRAHTRNVPRPGYCWPFRLDLRGRGLRGSRIHVLARLPDGSWQPLPDSPLLLPPAIRSQTHTARLLRWRKARQPFKPVGPVPIARTRPIDIVIPVYRRLRETLACIDSVLSTAGGHARVIVIDDATVDAELATALDELSAAGRITLLRNENNLGFVRSVNRALAMDCGHDVVLLNSDTLVFDAWLQRLRAAAYSQPRVGTVTPFSNDGSIASYPNRFGGVMGADEAAALNELAARTHAGISAEIPVGVGFCLFIRHDCLKEVGPLDAATFGVGYGEESDFCLRARARGWLHQMAADVFVFHAGGGSFGPRRAALLERSQRLLNLRYPGYDRYITEFLTQDLLLPLRRRLDERRLAAFEGRFVLLVTLALEGGVERYVAQRKQQIRAQHLFPLVLKPDASGDPRCYELLTDALDVPNLRYTHPANTAELTALLAQLRLDRIEIQHFLDLDAAIIEAVRALGVPYDIMIHDYAWICPRITLIDGSGRYCGEPPVSVCKSCVRKNGSRLPATLSVPALRARSADWLSKARTVSAPSSDTAARLKRYFPDLDVIVHPHTPISDMRRPVPFPNPKPLGTRSLNLVRVGLIGAIGSHKGYGILLECAQDAASRRLPLEFVVVGYTQNDAPLLRTGKVDVTGRYVDAEVPHLLQREQPDLVFLPSVWPETWCYALDHALSAGLPIVAFDIGAIAERLRAVARHTLLPLDLEPRQINERLLDIVAHKNAALHVQTSRPPTSDVTYDIKTTGAKTMTPNEPTQGEGLSASLQVLPLPPGLYLFSVTSATPAGDPATGALRLPAMHVDLGPGVRSDQVEFVVGPGTEGAWLFARGDMLIAKVNGAGATLILTSVRASNGDVLSIAVERLESRSQSGHAPAPADRLGVNLPAAVAGGSDARSPVMALSKPGANGADDDTLPVQIKTHIRSRGDMSFTDTPWAGRVAPGLWLESFSLQPLRSLSARDVEYKGLTGTGFETPWLSDDQNCGTKGMSVPLVGFAARLKPSPHTALYDCEYSGYFQSGTIVGPLRNGAPCRSTVANDPLEGIQIRFVRRVNAVPGKHAQDETAARAGAKELESTRPVKRAKAERAADKAASNMRSATQA